MLIGGSRISGVAAIEAKTNAGHRAQCPTAALASEIDVETAPGDVRRLFALGQYRRTLHRGDRRR